MNLSAAFQRQRRLWLACGPTEVLTCKIVHSTHFPFSFGRDVLVHYGRAISVPKELRDETMRIASARGFWDEAIDFVDETATIDGAAAPDLRFIRERLGPGVTHIVTNSLEGTTERAIFDAYPDAKIIFYDNGLASHNSKTVSPPGASPKPNSIRESDIARVEHAYFTFADRLPMPSHMTGVATSGLTTDQIVRALRKAKKLQADMHPELSNMLSPGTSYHLVLGTAFYRSSALSYETERDIYRRHVDGLLANPDNQVIYKDHPRANRETLLASHERLAVLKSTSPVELLPLFATIESSASISSTALIYLQKVFGIPANLLSIPTALFTRFPHIGLLYEALGATKARTLQNT